MACQKCKHNFWDHRIVVPDDAREERFACFECADDSPAKFFFHRERLPTRRSEFSKSLWEGCGRHGSPLGGWRLQVGRNRLPGDALILAESTDSATTSATMLI